jgi:NAD(P)H-dependent FMN reductase
VLSLAGHRVSFADGRPLDGYPDDTGRIVGAIAAADAVLLASPVYRASFTGALKNLLDLTPIESLRAKPVGIVAMGATPHHYLGVDWQLRAVLAWFGALVVPTSVYLESGHFQDGRLADAAAAAALTDLVRALVAMTGHARGRARLACSWFSGAGRSRRRAAGRARARRSSPSRRPCGPPAAPRDPRGTRWAGPTPRTVAR